jgi:formylglycine-generating enzyme required for sulfatase activity
VEKLVGWYRDDPDSGIHGALTWLLGHDRDGWVDRPLKWGQASRLKKIDEELKARDPDGKRGWYVNRQGQTMVLIPGPVEYRMGSPLTEEGRFEAENPHRRRIPRSFAIGATSVTVEHFKRFLKDRPDVRGEFTNRYSPEGNGPTIGVTWYIAAQYCNWLSEKEGIPETEWCYPAHADIKAGMKPHADYLKRKGYRLPTEAEWEYAARAGTVTSRYYGSSVELLPRYAWFLQNSKPDDGDNRAWPVGQKRPNDLGLLDMHGNVWNWVYAPAETLPKQQGTSAIADSEDLRQIREEISRVLRGGAFGSQPSIVRLPNRYFRAPSVRGSGVGLRLARTYR